MKRVLLAMILVMLLILSACGAKTEQGSAVNADGAARSIQPSENETYSEAGNDYTVKGDFRVYHDIGSKSIISVTTHLDFSTPFPDLESLVSHSDDVIEFRVDEIKYAFLEGSGYTICDVTVTKAFTGELMTGDRISLLQYGGIFTIDEEIGYWDDDEKFSHLTEEEKQNTLIVSNVLVGVDYHVGDIFVGFIVRDDFLEGSYCTLNCGEGVFVYQDDKTLTRYCKDIYEQNEIKYSDLLNIQK